MEIEPEWAYQAVDNGWADGENRRVVVGDSRDLTTLLNETPIDCIVTSPVYGNRMSDSFLARDGSKRNTYHHQLGRRPSDGSAAKMHFGRSGDYEDLHISVWRECFAVLTPGGRMVVNVSDFLRTIPVSRLDSQGEYSSVIERNNETGKARVRMEVVRFHLEAMESLGFSLRDHLRVRTPRQRHGQNAEVRVEDESVLVLEKPAAEGQD